MVYRICANHPRVNTRRACRCCGKPICRACMIKTAYRVFCSKRCFYRHLLHNDPSYFFKKLGHHSRNRLKRLVLLPFWSRRRAAVFCGMNLALLAIFIVRAHHFEAQFKEMFSYSRSMLLSITEPASAPVRQPAVHIPGFNILAPGNGTRLAHPVFDIVGEAADHTDILLKHNGVDVQRTRAQGGSFRFTGVIAGAGSNIFTLHAVDARGHVTVEERLHLTLVDRAPVLAAPDIAQVFNGRRQIALTFDGGCCVNAADDILAALAERDLRVTFFLTGEFISQFPDMVQRIVAAGHEIGNHTWDHPHLTTYGQNQRHLSRPEVNREWLHSQLHRTAQLFAATTGQAMAPYWRAPFGEQNREIRSWAAELGYTHVSWTRAGAGKNLDTRDWIADRSAPGYRTGPQTLSYLLRAADSNGGHGLAGGIVLMHLGTTRQSDQIHQILPELLDGLLQRHYAIVTVSELLAPST